jgi:hypothetical protein
MKSEEKKDAEAPKQEFEMKKKNKKSTVALNFEASSHALTPQIRKQFLEFETKWYNADRDILDNRAAKVNLESYCYSTKSDLESYGPLEKYMEEGARKEFIGQLQQTIDWLYADGQSVGYEIYQQKLDDFRKTGYPVKER